MFCARKHGREADRVPAPAARAGAGGDLRHLRLPGAGDARRAGAGRLLARRRRHAAPGDGQEEARGDGQAAPDLPRRRGAGRASREAKADEVFDLMEKFAGYGFNKSHAAAYALLAYHTAWLKVHCTAEFYAANMTVELDDTDKLKVLARRRQAVRHRASSRPTSTAASIASSRSATDRCATAWARSRAPARARSRPSLPHATARASAKARAAALTAACSTSAARVDRQRVNKRVVEALIKAGAFDALHPDRATRAGQRRPGLRLGRDPGRACRPGRPVRLRRLARRAARRSRRWCAAEPWSVKERLTLEKSALGFYLSGHLFEQSASRGAAVRQAPHRRPGRYARAAIAGRHRQRPARGQRPARPGRDLQARRRQRIHRGGGQRRPARRQPRAAARRRAGHRAGQGAARPLCRRPAPERQPGVGPAGRARTLRQVPGAWR